MGGPVAFLSRAAPRAEPSAPADLIFVFAGSDARKEFGVLAWRRGGAPVLVVSVGRFEWRRYERLGLPGDLALREAVARVPPRERHFFVVVEGDRAEVLPVPRRPFGTRNESRALAALVRERGWRAVTVISSGFHLRRVALALGRALRGTGAVASYAALPAGADRYAPGRWWRTPRGIRVVASEVVKLAVYSAFLKP